MKVLRYSQDYREKIIKMRKYIDSYFGKIKRKEVFTKINSRIHEVRENENIGISVKNMFGIDTIKWNYQRRLRNHKDTIRRNGT